MFMLIIATFLLIEAIFSLIIAISIKDIEQKQDYFPKVSVISYAWNSGNVIKRKIENFLNLDYPNYEIIIADNGSMDETKEICEKYEARGEIKYFREEEHKEKKAPVIDKAIEKHAEGEVLAFTDPDGVCEKGWLKKIVQPLKKDEIGAVAGTTHCGNYYENWFTRIRGIEDEWMYSISNLGRYRLPDFVNLFCGANYALKKSTWEAIGGHGDKSLVEDVETGLNLYAHDYEISAANAQVWQEEVRNLDGYIKQRIRWQSFSQNFLNYPEGTKKLLKHPFGLNLLGITGGLPILSFLTLVGTILLPRAAIFGFAFLIFALSSALALKKVGKGNLISYLPLYLVLEGPMKVMVSAILIKKKIFNEDLEWKPLASGEKYHKGIELRKN